MRYVREGVLSKNNAVAGVVLYSQNAHVAPRPAVPAG